MAQHTVEREVVGPWSLATSRDFWEGFTPTALPGAVDDALHTVFLVAADWSRATATVTQRGTTAIVEVEGDGDLDAAADQVARFLALDIDASAWPEVGTRDPVIGEAQRALPGLRPCGFQSPYEAAMWAVLAQRIRIVQAAKLRADLTLRYGDGGAVPAPGAMLGADLDLPGRKAEYLRAVAEAALDGVFDWDALRSMSPESAVQRVQQVKGLGPFAAELVVLRGANTPDMLPTQEPRLNAEVLHRYGRPIAEVGDGWRPFRTWAAVHLRALREERTHEIAG